MTCFRVQRAYIIVAMVFWRSSAYVSPTGMAKSSPMLKSNQEARNIFLGNRQKATTSLAMDIVGVSPEPIHTAFALATFFPQPFWLLMILLPSNKITKKVMGSLGRWKSVDVHQSTSSGQLLTIATSKTSSFSLPCCISSLWLRPLFNRAPRRPYWNSMMYLIQAKTHKLHSWTWSLTIRTLLLKNGPTFWHGIYSWDVGYGSMASNAGYFLDILFSFATWLGHRDYYYIGLLAWWQAKALVSMKLQTKNKRIRVDAENVSDPIVHPSVVIQKQTLSENVDLSVVLECTTVY